MKNFPWAKFIIFVILCCATYWNAATFAISGNDFTQALYLGAAVLSGLGAAAVVSGHLLEVF